MLYLQCSLKTNSALQPHCIHRLTFFTRVKKPCSEHLVNNWILTPGHPRTNANQQHHVNTHLKVFSHMSKTVPKSERSTSSAQRYRCPEFHCMSYSQNTMPSTLDTSSSTAASLALTFWMNQIQNCMCNHWFRLLLFIFLNYSIFLNTLEQIIPPPQ